MGKDSAPESRCRLNSRRLAGSRNNGYVSLLVLLVVIVLSWNGWEAFSKVHSQERMVDGEAWKMKAVFLADSGLEWAKSSLAEDPEWSGGVKVFDDGQVRVQAVKLGNAYRVIARGEAGEAGQKRFGVLEPDSQGILRLIRYEELYN